MSATVKPRRGRPAISSILQTLLGVNGQKALFARLNEIVGEDCARSTDAIARISAATDGKFTCSLVPFRAMIVNASKKGLFRKDSPLGKLAQVQRGRPRKVVEDAPVTPELTENESAS